MYLAAININLNQPTLIGIFVGILLLFLIVDLGIFNRHPKRISFKAATWQTIMWVSIATSFGILIWISDGRESAIQFISAYLMEWSLSVDNIFIFLLIFNYFKIEDKHYHRILSYGIIGAILFRGIFITIGVVLIHQFHWILYIFGAILIYTGLKMLYTKKDQVFNAETNPTFRFLKNRLRFIESQDGFLKRIDGKLSFTTLFLVVILIETTDIVFALDSIPAVFAITQDSFIIYTSNIFAVLGLRAMFFLLSGVIDKFRYLQQGISFILVFIGVKMLLEMFDFVLPTSFSLMIIVMFLFLSIVASVVDPWAKRDE